MALFQSPRRFEGRIAVDRLDWRQASIDIGTTPPPPRRDTGLAFNPDNLSWPLLEKLERWQGSLDAQFGALRLRNGVELRGTHVRFGFDGATLDLDPVQGELLGGHGSARLHFDAAKRSVKVSFQGEGLLLERWFQKNAEGYAVRKDLRRAVVFGVNNLVSDAPISAIVCGCSSTTKVKRFSGPALCRNPKGTELSDCLTLSRMALALSLPSDCSSRSWA